MWSFISIGGTTASALPHYCRLFLKIVFALDIALLYENKNLFIIITIFIDFNIDSVQNLLLFSMRTFKLKFIKNTKSVI